MKKVFVFIFYFGTFWTSSKLHAQDLALTLYNKTGFDLDSVSVRDVYFGEILKDQSKSIGDIDELVFQGLVPLFRPSAIIQGKKLSSVMAPCSTKSKKKQRGSYAFDILLYERGEELRFYWGVHYE